MSRSRMGVFYTILITQLVSLVGSQTTGIAIGIWLFERTGNSAPVLTAIFFSTLPLALGGSFAGVLVDRWNRRRILLWSDAGQALGTALLLLSLASGRFQIWHLYTIACLQGTLAVFQRPAMDASVTMLVPDGERDRANGLRQIAGPLAGVLAPVLAGFLYAVLGVVGIMWLDLASFSVAVTALYLVEIPQPAAMAVRRPGLQALAREFAAGLGFLWERRLLFWLMIYAAGVNFLLAGPMALSTPYLISLTGSEALLGLLLGLLNLGMIVGGLLMFVWGGTRPRIHGIMVGLLVRGLFLGLYGVARTPAALGAVLFFLFFTNALVDGSFMSLLQAKVPAGLQGRVFALLAQLMSAATPLSLLLTAHLADRVLEPAVGGPGWAPVAPLFGAEAGSGMGLLVSVAGLLLLGLTAMVYALPRVRRVETELPDVGVDGA